MARKSGVKDVIFDVWQDNLDWSPKDIRTTVQEKLGARRSKKGTYPGLRLVQQYVAEFKKNLGQLVDEDKPWSIAASLKYGIPPEASKDLFDMWRFSLAMDRPISIRQAKWIVYIRNLFYQDISTGNRYSDKVNRNLWLIRQSWLYSILERASQIMGEQHFDTSDLDAASFMPLWEYATAVKLGKVSHVNYPQEALTKIGKHGTSLTSPPQSVKSVEQAVWHSVRTAPPPDFELMDTFGENALPEEDDLVCAYWLNYLSNGPNWKSLDYFEQRGILLDLRTWVQQHSNMSIRDYYSLPKKENPMPLPPKLLEKVGYEIPIEYLNEWFQLHEKELKAKHNGWGLIPTEVQQRFINDNETDEDLDLLNNADSQKEIEQSKREQEFIKLVQQSGGEPKIMKHKFWQSIRKKWIKKHPEYTQQFPEAFEMEYARLIKEGKVHLNREQEAQNEGTHRKEV